MSTGSPSNDPPVALVTGGARRVGRAIALALAEAGYDIAITYHTSSAEAQQVVRQIKQRGRAAAAIHADLSHNDAAAQIHESFATCFNRLDALVNNAAIFEQTPFGQITAEQFDRHMMVNGKTPLLLIQRFASMLGAHGAQHPGRVVNMLDVHVMGQPMKQYAAYNASKAALLEITRTMAVELAPRVLVNGIAPGVVAWSDSFTQSQRQSYLQRVPLERAGTPEDVAATVLFLVRDAGYVTGSVLPVDGGRGLG